MTLTENILITHYYKDSPNTILQVQLQLINYPIN